MSKSESRQFLKQLRVALYTVIITLVIPFIILVTLPVLVYRQLNQWWAHKFHKDSETGTGTMGQMLKPIAQTVVHDFFKASPGLNVVVCWTGEGHLPLETLRDVVSKNLIEAKVGVGKTAKLEYPELRCNITKIGGYFYFKKIPDFAFDIKDYVRTYEQNQSANEDVVTTEEVLKDNIAKLVARGWDENKAPWEILLINNYADGGSKNRKKSSVVILRVHHHLADGYSLLQMFKRLGAEGSQVKVSATANSNLERKLVATTDKDGVKRTNQLLSVLLVPLLLPYETALMLDEFTQQKTSCWRLSPEKRRKAGQNRYQTWTSRIPVETMKRIKERFGVSFQAVLNSVFAGAIHNLMKSTGQEVPEEISSLLPIPIAGHPGGLVNHFGYLLVRLPVAETDPVRRLQLSVDELHRLSKSKLPLMTFLLYNLVGMFPSFVTQVMTAVDIGYSVLFSPFPGFDGNYSIGNTKGTDCMFTLGAGWGDAGATLTTLTCLGHIKFGITIDQQVYPSKEKLNQFNEVVNADIQRLLEAKVV